MKLFGNNNYKKLVFPWVWKGWLDGVWLFFCFYIWTSLIIVKKILHVFSIEKLDWMWVFWDGVSLFCFYKRVSMILGHVKHITYWNYLERLSTKKFILSDVEVPENYFFFGRWGMLEIEFYCFFINRWVRFITKGNLIYLGGDREVRDGVLLYFCFYTWESFFIMKYTGEFNSALSWKYYM